MGKKQKSYKTALKLDLTFKTRIQDWSILFQSSTHLEGISNVFTLVDWSKRGSDKVLFKLFYDDSELAVMDPALEGRGSRTRILLGSKHGVYLNNSHKKNKNRLVSCIQGDTCFSSFFQVVMYRPYGPHISTFTPRDAQWGCSPALKEPTPTFYLALLNHRKSYSYKVEYMTQKSSQPVLKSKDSERPTMAKI